MASMKKYNYILFHHPCNDGFLSFVLLHKFGLLENDVYTKGVPADITKVPPNIKNRDVIIVDLNIKTELLMKIVEISRSVFFIDHHHERNANLNHPKLTVLVNLESCSSKIIWDTFNPNKRKKMPDLIKYVDDLDRMANKYPESSVFMTAYEVHYNDDFGKNDKSIKEKNMEKVEKISALLDNPKEQKKLVKLGAQYSLYKYQITKRSMNNFESVTVKTGENRTWKVLVSNIGGFCAKLVSSQFQMFDTFDCTMTWYYNCQIKGIIVLCRSKHHNITWLLQRYNGDGHERAGTFKFGCRSIYDWLDHHNGCAI
jgi:hypothetical protein